MAGDYLIDTNVMILFFANDPAVENRLLDAPNVRIPSIVVGEMYFGAFKSARREENIKKLRTMIPFRSVLSCDVETAKEYGRIKDELRRKGSPVPDNDIWIAALAMQHALRLVTRDKDFAAIDNLQLERW